MSSSVTSLKLLTEYGTNVSCTKLSSLVQGNLLTWFKSYLSARKQRVIYANSSSQFHSISAGVPQGSIIGPLLFFVYINDIVDPIRSNIRLFADDTGIYITIDSPTDAALQLNTDLESINLWSKSWLVAFNPAKSESHFYSRKLNKPNHPPLYFNNVEIKDVTTHKQLGLTLSDDCKWTDHISVSLNKAWQRVGLLRSLKFKLNRQYLEKMYSPLFDLFSNTLTLYVTTVQTS